MTALQPEQPAFGSAHPNSSRVPASIAGVLPADASIELLTRLSQPAAKHPASKIVPTPSFIHRSLHEGDGNG